MSKLFLERFNFAGVLDDAVLCNSPSLAASLSVLSLNGSNICRGITAEIGNCSQLERLHLSGNRLSGNLPSSLAMLNNLERLDVSNNKFSAELPGLSGISDLNVLLAQNNRLRGKIPEFCFSNLIKFNLSFINLSGRIPDLSRHFFVGSFLGNPGLCGCPLPNNCSAVAVHEKPEESEGSKRPSGSQIIMYSGYAALGLTFIILIVYKLCTRKTAGKKIEAVNEVTVNDHDDMEKPSTVSRERQNISVSKSDFSLTWNWYDFTISCSS